MSDTHTRLNPKEIAVLNGSYIVEAIATGAFGETFLLGNGRVLKLTRMREEWTCVDWIRQQKFWEMTPHLPVVYATGEGWMEFAEKLVRHYWYIREGLDDLTTFDVEAIEQESEEPVENILAGIIDNLRDQGLEIRDARRLDNWGKRSFRWRFEVVLRDLWCIKVGGA